MDGMGRQVRYDDGEWSREVEVRGDAYTPSTEAVREAWLDTFYVAEMDGVPPGDDVAADAGFDRWLASVRADAIRSAAAQARLSPKDAHMFQAWLYAFAGEIEKVAR